MVVVREKVCVDRIGLRGVREKVCVDRIGFRGVRKKVCVDRVGSRGVREKVCVDRIGSRGVQHNNRRREMRLRGILIFRGVVVDVAKANKWYDNYIWRTS